MSVSFLDKSGLSYFWGKIKAWCNSLFALDSAVVHKTDSISETVTGAKTFTSSIEISNSDPILLCKDTSIAKGTAPSVDNFTKVVSVRDSNNVLCACIEHAYTVNRSNMLNFITYSGTTNTADYSAASVLSVGVSFLNGSYDIKQILARTSIWLINSNLSKGTVPSANRNTSIYFCDNTSVDWSTSVLGEIVCVCNTSNITYVQLRAFQNVAGSSTYAALSCVYDTANNKSYCTAPTPALTAGGDEIVTALWISKKCLPSTLYLDAVNGNDSNDGFTSSSAKKTIANIEATINSSSFSVPSSITVVVASGTYTDTIQGSFRTFIYYKFSSGAIIRTVYIYGPRMVRLAGTFTMQNNIFASTGGVIELGIGGLATSITFSNVDIFAALRSQAKGIIQVQYGATSVSVTLSGTCKFTNLIDVDSGGYMGLSYGGGRLTWTGTASSGRKYHVGALSELLGKGADSDIPGSGTLVDALGYVAA